MDYVPHIAGIEDLSRLSVLTDLTTLHIGHSDIDRRALHDFRDFFPYLRQIHMAYSQFLTHSGARFRFSSFPHLVALTLDGYADMRDLTPLKNLPHFEAFSFRNCNLQNEWLTALSFTTKLEFLALSENPNLTDEGIAHTLVLRSLRNLECNGLSYITRIGVGSVANRLTQLTCLQIRGTSIVPEDLGLSENRSRNIRIVF